GGDMKKAPGYKTASLIDDQKNRMYASVVRPLRVYISAFITWHNKTTGRRFLIQTLDQKFLQSDDMENLKLFFVANLHEVYNLRPLNSSRMISNDFTLLKVIDTLFNIGLITDQVLEKRSLTSNSGKKNMANAVYQMA